jgi:peptidyl-prolyl cis-trans isomerase D
MALRYLRENLKHLKWVLWGVVIVMVAFIFFGWGGWEPGMKRDTDAAATVGSETITYADFQRQYQNLEAQMRQAFGEQFDREMIKQFNLPQRALDQLIDRRILLMEARDAGLDVTDAEVKKAILEFPTFKDATGKFIGNDAYKRILRANRMTVDDFERSMRDEVLIGKLESILTATAYVSDQTVERAYRDQNERAKIRWVELPASRFEEIVVDDAEIAAYFADHSSDYELPEQRVVDYLLVDTIKLRREIEIPEQELRAYYDDHPDEFTRDEQVRASHILFKVTPDRPDEKAREDLLAVRRRVEGGEDFAELARTLSEDEGSASRGGSLGYFGRGAMIPAFEEAAFAAKPGDLVGPIKTDFGYHLIEVQDHRQGGMQPFEQVQAVVRSRLVGERVEEIASQKAQDVAARLKARTEEAPADGAEATDPMAVLAEEEGLELQTTEPFGRNDTIVGIGRDPALSAQIFELEEGAVTAPAKVPRGWIIARLAEIKPPRTPELAEVEDEVKTAVEQEKRSHAAVARLGEAAAGLAAGATLDDLAGKLELEVQDSEEFGRFGNIAGLSSGRKVIDAALKLEEGERSEPIETADGAVLFEVVERKTFDRTQFEEEKEATRSGEEAQRVNQLMASLIELRRRDLAPTYDPKVFANFGIGTPGTPGS